MNCFCSYSHFIIIFFPFKFWFEPIGFSTAKTIFFSSGCRVYYVGNHKNQTYRQVYWLIWFSKQTKYNDQMDPPTDFKWMDFLSTILCIFNDVSTVIDVYMKIIFHLKSKNVFFFFFFLWKIIKYSYFKFKNHYGSITIYLLPFQNPKL